MTVSVIMYKGLGISNTDIALYTSWLYLPWVLKPLWSPLVDILKTRRAWIWLMQLLIGAGLAGVALTIPTPHFFQWTLVWLWLLAFSSATHDIAADGFYMLATTETEQAFFVGIRSTFYRISMISGQGLLVMLAALIQSHTGLPRVELRVESSPGAALVQKVAPESLIAVAPSQGGLRAITEPPTIQINPEPRRNAEVSTLLASAKEWNLTNGFTQVPQQSALPNNREKTLRWWTRRVAQPLGNILQRHFGRQSKTRSDTVGNVGLCYVRLSKPPGKQLVVSLSLKTGDKSISLAEGSRLVFDDQNWNKPAIAVVQLDPKLKNQAPAVYELRSGNLKLSWVIAFFVLVALFVLFGIYHRFSLPYPASDRPKTEDMSRTFLREFFQTFAAFFCRKSIGVLLLFLLFYRFAEAQLVKMVTPFLLDMREDGGLGLTTGQVGFAYGTIGIIALTCGGLLGGMVASRQGLKFWLWPMVLSMHLPDAVFVYLAYTQPDNFVLINVCVAVEQFGYGFGFTAYMLYMLYIARGRHETAHYAICTGFMALGMMLPGMFSGWLEDLLGYQHFFLWVMLATLPGFLVVAFVPLDREFGKKSRVA